MSSVTEPPSQEPKAKGNPTPAKKRNYKKIIVYAIAGIVVLFIIIVISVNSATKAPVDVSNQFIDSIQSGNSRAAYELFYSDTKKTVPADKFDGIVKQIGPILNTNEKITGKSINGETGKAATSEVTYDVNGTDGKNYAVIVNLTKENGNWKVLNFDSQTR